MRLFDSIDALASVVDLVVVPDLFRFSRLPGFAVESDWAYRCAGEGLPGGTGGGWLVTRASASDAPWEPGHLIAYAIGADGQKTGACGLLRSPWPSWVDATERARVLAAPWWRGSGARSSSGEVDLDLLDLELVRPHPVQVP